MAEELPGFSIQNMLRWSGGAVERSKRSNGSNGSNGLRSKPTPGTRRERGWGGAGWDEGEDEV